VKWIDICVLLWPSTRKVGQRFQEQAAGNGGLISVRGAAGSILTVVVWPLCVAVRLNLEIKM